MSLTCCKGGPRNVGSVGRFSYAKGALDRDEMLYIFISRLTRYFPNSKGRWYASSLWTYPVRFFTPPLLLVYVARFTLPLVICVQHCTQPAEEVCVYKLSGALRKTIHKILTDRSFAVKIKAKERQTNINKYLKTGMLVFFCCIVWCKKCQKVSANISIHYPSIRQIMVLLFMCTI